MSALFWLWAIGAAGWFTWLIVGRMGLYMIGKAKVSGLDTTARRIVWLAAELKLELGDAILWPLSAGLMLLRMSDRDLRKEVEGRLAAGDIELNHDAPMPLPPEDDVSEELRRTWQAHLDGEVKDAVNIPDLVKFYPLLVSSWEVLQRGFPQWCECGDRLHAQRMFLEIAKEISDPETTVS